MAIPNCLTISATGCIHPLFLYGTAWKKSSTCDLVQLALKQGFTGIDTACQPKHYREDLVGDGLTAFLKSQKGESFTEERNKLFIQTKFTSPSGQDLNQCPYNCSASLMDQISSSVRVSLSNLKIDRIDSLLLHSPLRSFSETVKAWSILEQFVKEGLIGHLGISNCRIDELKMLYDCPEVIVKPSIVQNRFCAQSQYDRDVRLFCKHHGLIYQSFWTLTANPDLIASYLVSSVFERLKTTSTPLATREAVFYALVMGLGRNWTKGGIAILNGTKREMTMKEDLEVAIAVAELSESEISQFKQLINDYN